MASVRQCSAEADEEDAGENGEGGGEADAATGLAEDDDADENGEEEADLPHRHRVAHRRHLQTVTEREEGAHHHRSGGEDEVAAAPPFGDDAATIAGTEEVEGHEDKHEHDQEIGEVEGGIAGDPGFVDDGAEGIDEAGEEGGAHRGIGKIGEGAQQFGKGDPAQLHRPGAEDDEEDAGNAEGGEALAEEENPPERHVEDRGLGQGVDQGQFARAISPPGEEMIENETGAPRRGQQKDLHGHRREGAGEEREGEIEEQARGDEHPPDEDGLVPAAFDQQVPEGVHQGREEDEEKSQGTHGGDRNRCGKLWRE